MRFVNLGALILSASVCFASPTAPVALNELILPSPLQKVAFGKTTPEDIIKTLGAPKEKSHDKVTDIYFYNLTGKNYDTTVAFKNKKLQYVIYSPSAPKITFKQLGKWVSTDDLVAVVKKNNKKVSATSGREIKIEKKNLGTLFVFTDNHDLSLRSVTVWEAGEPAP